MSGHQLARTCRPPNGPPAATAPEYFENWLDNDGAPFWSFWENVRSWWEIRHLPNVHLVHFADLKADTENQIRRIADFIGTPADAAGMDRVLSHCSSTI